MPVFAIVLLVVSVVFMIGIISWSVTKYRRMLGKSRDIISDRDLLLLINEEPDRIISASNLAKKTEMNINQASMRLSRLNFNGLVRAMSSGFKSFYELKKEIDSKDLLQLSEKPFISIEDLFTLFKHFEHKMDLQDICVATGLPFKVIKREMKYFEKEGIVHYMHSHSTDGTTANRFYTLQDAYKGNSGNNDLRFEAINLDLEKIYREELNDDDFV